jgi:hypothetical protein
MIKKIRLLKGIPVYCDTDSVFFQLPNHDLQSGITLIHDKFPVNSGLGNVSFEVYRNGVFLNAKAYRLESYLQETKLKNKGIPYENRLEYQTTGKTIYKRPQKLRPALRGVNDLDANIWYDFCIEQKGKYKKRKKSASLETDFFRTVPIEY